MHALRSNLSGVDNLTWARQGLKTDGRRQMIETAKVITVGLADGRKSVSTRMAQALTDLPGVACVLAADAAEAVRLVRAQTVDVILMDLHIAPAGALGLLDPLLETSPDTRAVVVVPPGGDFEPAVLVAHGARGFLSSEADGAMVRKCVNTVFGGEYWLARDQVGPLLEHLRTDVPAGSASLDQLTPRERDIVRAILRGASNGAIASDFALSPQTVRNHLSSIYLKLGVSTRLELALRVMHMQRSAR
jgi:DNA-binding NarL/FixJ family response regulator